MGAGAVTTPPGVCGAAGMTEVGARSEQMQQMRKSVGLLTR